MNRCILLTLWLSCMAAATTAQSSPSDEDGFELGAAIRFNLGWRDYGSGSGNGRPELELLRLEARGRSGPLLFSSQYRWYDGFDAVHHAFLGWSLAGDSDLRLGVQQVPFGLLPHASHSFWFGAGYYLGIEDDYDPGLVYRREDESTSLHLGMFTGDEYGTGARYARYSFDVATTPALPYRERERLHLRHARRLQRGTWDVEIGGSGFVGRVENVETGQKHDHTAWAIHGQFDRGPWSLQAQWAWYRYDVPGERIALSAFRFPFEIAADAHVLTGNVAYTLPQSGWFDSITCYNNLSTVRADGPTQAHSWQNVSGCSFGKGVMFTYVDWIAGRNMWFIGGPGVGIDEPGGDRWRSRLNVNLGFYF
jgi:hypothetical protein